MSMLNKNELETKLRDLGFKENELGPVMADVTRVILDKALGRYFSALPKEEQSRLKGLSADEMKKYFEENAERLPRFPNEKFERVYDATWKEYFNAISRV